MSQYFRGAVNGKCGFTNPRTRKKGVPFRDAHEVVGKVVRFAIDAGKDLAALSLTALKKFNPTIEADVFETLGLEGSVASRNLPGGTAPAQVKQAIVRARERLNRP